MSLEDEYRRMHEKGKYFPGFSISPYVDAIAALVAQHQPERMLDYGSGRGLQYLKRRVHERWGGLLPHCYDIGVSGLMEKPEGPFGGVLCVDVLEHIERADILPTLAELVNYVAPGGFLFMVISCRPTKKKLSDGRDVHVTIERPSWWIERIKSAQASLRREQLHIIAHFDVAGHFDEPDSVWDSLA
jgi:SAM-dependent methyltransferase